MKNITFIKGCLLFLGIVSFPIFNITAGAPDGTGPWADSVVSSNQGTMKNGQPVPAARSNPQATVGVAENSFVDTDFFSLGFGGNIVLQFENGVRDGIVVVETTFSGYPVEKAEVAVSIDGSNWVSAGTVNQDGQVSMPGDLSCVKYIKITDISNSSDFSDDTADAFDVDGVQAVNSQSCDNPTLTPTQSPENTPSPTPTPPAGSSSNNSSSSNTSSQPKECTAAKPGTPSITGVLKTSATTVKLTWTSALGASTYAISYGTSKGNYQYGVPSTGNVNEFIIGGLDPNATYYFVVRAIKDCMPGDASSEQTSSGQILGAATGDVLGATTDQLAATGSLQSWLPTVVASISAMGAYMCLVALTKKQTKN